MRVYQNRVVYPQVVYVDKVQVENGIQINGQFNQYLYNNSELNTIMKITLIECSIYSNKTLS